MDDSGLQAGACRVALGLEYDGSRFFGFQTQRQEPTVQQVLEKALSRVANHAVRVHVAGRTDTGVHAICQVVHFDARAERSERGWVLGCNTHLPDGISVLWARLVEPGFHARFSARARHYRYRILNRWVRPGLLCGRVAWDRRTLNVESMREAGQLLIGEHDFSSFRALGCQARHPMRCIQSLNVSRHEEEIRIDVTANAFLYHMVRNIAGTLLEVGSGKHEPEWVAEVRDARKRAVAGFTAPAEGLYFLGVDYPDYPELPTRAIQPFPRGWDLSG